VPINQGEPAAEANRLRRIIEKQPACLFRVGLDGLILASNEAGLGLLGAQHLSQVLETLLTTWIVPEHHEKWQKFAQTVAGGTSQSMDCELMGVSGRRRHVDLHAVPLVDHPDGIPSLILGARDTTAQRRIEAALHDQQPAAESRDTDGDRERLEQAASKLPELERLLMQGRTHLQDLRERLASATDERDTLTTRTTALEAENEGLRATLDALTAQLKAAIAQANESDKALADHRVELQSIDSTVRHMEPLAAAGRLALDVARDLATVAADIDARAACLIAESPVDSSSREQIEQLRTDAVRMSSLVRQMLQLPALTKAEEKT